MTFQEDAPEPGRVLELDVHIKPRGDVGHALALYVEGKLFKNPSLHTY